MKKLIALALLGLAFTAKSQIIEETAKVLSKPSGEALFSLEADEKVFSFAPEDGWYKIRKEVYVDPKNVVDDKYIISGADFFTKENVKIGSTLAEIKIKEGEKVEAFRGNDRFRAIVEGYLFKTKFVDGSVPEERISELLALKNRNEQAAGFKELFETYKFEEKKFEELVVHVYREENKTLKEDKDFRVIMIFRGETSPYAVMTNDHEVTAPKIKQTWEEYDFKVIYFYKPTSTQQELVQDKILYTFLGL
ncbi:hypothetical protein [Owenweeksia hongkongensis]|uniref:hypothetical protein n=1 Tax=Owenweeksia hongkongensis TaxID=253245 RepID=UPI003A8EA9D6